MRKGRGDRVDVSIDIVRSLIDVSLRTVMRIPIDSEVVIVETPYTPNNWNNRLHLTRSLPHTAYLTYAFLSLVLPATHGRFRLRNFCYIRALSCHLALSPTALLAAASYPGNYSILSARPWVGK